MNQQSVEMLRQLGRQESARLFNGGSILDFQELQQQAREFANGDKEMEIAAFRCLEHVNDCETNRRTFDKGYRLFSSARYNREIQRLAKLCNLPNLPVFVRSKGIKRAKCISYPL